MYAFLGEWGLEDSPLEKLAMISKKHKHKEQTIKENLLEEKQCLLENKRALKPLQENILYPSPSLLVDWMSFKWNMTKQTTLTQRTNHQKTWGNKKRQERKGVTKKS